MSVKVELSKEADLRDCFDWRDFLNVHEKSASATPVWTFPHVRLVN